MGRMSDEDLARLIREIPRGTSSSDFAAAVRRKLDSRRSGSRVRRRKLGFAIASVAMLGVGVSQSYLRERYERSKTAERVRALRAEYRELSAEFEKLRALREELEPVLDLGGTGDVEFVFDLRELAGREDAEGRTTPVSHSSR